MVRNHQSVDTLCRLLKVENKNTVLQFLFVIVDENYSHTNTRVLILSILTVEACVVQAFWVFFMLLENHNDSPI